MTVLADHSVRADRSVRTVDRLAQSRRGETLWRQILQAVVSCVL